MDLIELDGVLEAVLFVRSDLPEPSQRRADAVTEELRTLAGDGTIDSFEHRAWPKRVPVDDCSSGVRDVYLEWTDWARREGVQLQPFFDTRECYTPDAETYTDWLVVPAMALAVTVGDEILSVYPHVDGTETVSIEDGLDALDRDELDAIDSQVTVAD